MLSKICGNSVFPEGYYKKLRNLVLPPAQPRHGQAQGAIQRGQQFGGTVEVVGDGQTGGGTDTEPHAGKGAHGGGQRGQGGIGAGSGAGFQAERNNVLAAQSAPGRIPVQVLLDRVGQHEIEPRRRPVQAGLGHAGFQVADPGLPVAITPDQGVEGSLFGHHPGTEGLFDQVLELHVGGFDHLEEPDLVAEGSHEREQFQELVVVLVGHHVDIAGTVFLVVAGPEEMGQFAAGTIAIPQEEGFLRMVQLDLQQLRGI